MNPFFTIYEDVNYQVEENDKLLKKMTICLVMLLLIFVGSCTEVYALGYL